MRHATIPGIPNVYMENSFAGHKAIPGTYTISLKVDGGPLSTVSAKIMSNPLYEVTTADYARFDEVMRDMEAKVTAMHQMVNGLFDRQRQLADLVDRLKAESRFDEVRRQAEALLKDMKTWDEEMVQRKSKAYDDVENFPNRFTAEYMFMLNQTESDLPRVNQPSLDLQREYDAKWAVLKARGEEFTTKRLPELNKSLWAVGVGGVW
jgi:gamma-glutamylcysteine synthetase